MRIHLHSTITVFYACAQLNSLQMFRLYMV